jgi:hypothetical protein
MPDFDEAAFRKWFDPAMKQLKLSPDPDDPEAFYDYRGFYNAMKQGKYRSPTEPGQHWPSEFKDPNHPRAFLTDPVNQRYFDTQTGNYTGGAKEPVSEQRMRGLNAIETPDLPKREWNLAKGGTDKAVPDYKAIGENLTMPATPALQEQSPLTAARAQAAASPKDEDYISKLFNWTK